MSKVRKWIMEERSDSKDPAIKLFGKTIPVPIHAPDEVECRVQEMEEEGVVDELASSGSNSNGRRDSEKLVITGKEKNSTSETENEGKPKRPDKPVPCPRCDSLDTKFCYYNNYNINQPRHFCKNCQRYWTAGGSLRNVPVGAGRRKNKSSNHHHHHHQWHHLFQHQAMDVAIDSQQQQQQQDMMIVQELSPTRSIATHNSKTANVPPAAPTFHHLAATGAGLLSDSTNNSDVTSGSVCGSSPCNKNDKGMEGSASNPDHLTTWTGMGMPPGAAAMWGMQWAALAAVAAAAASTNSSPPGQALLGKRHATGDDDGHGDDGSDVKSGCLWVPKTLRIDDAAARSSIWNALGVDRGCAASEASSSKIGMQDAGKISN